MVKVISLSEEAYATLKSQKEKSDSFSDVVLRLSKRERKDDIREVFGVWKGDREMGKIFKNILKERRVYRPIKL
ncbi:MAG: antitoxin VapB family protein [Candidatus Aenigmarchaeota archaeon]|nr:antitoxin VapB family protein [Candidatus Aenigmarchaeota archaeon]